MGDFIKKAIYLAINMLEGFFVIGLLIYILVFRYFQSLCLAMQGNYTHVVVTLILMIAPPFIISAFDRQIDYLVARQILKKPYFIGVNEIDRNYH